VEPCATPFGGCQPDSPFASVGVEEKFSKLALGVGEVAASLFVALFLRLYGPRLIPFCRSLRTPSTQESGMPYLTQRSHGRCSSQRLQAFAQLVHAILTCLRLARCVLDGGGGA